MKAWNGSALKPSLSFAAVPKTSRSENRPSCPAFMTLTPSKAHWSSKHALKVSKLSSAAARAGYKFIPKQRLKSKVHRDTEDLRDRSLSKD